jgi:protein-S-isoprenylcysteine O-methyltransferase Ste14
MTDGQRAAAIFIDGAWIAWLVIWIVLAGRTKKIVRQENGLSRALHLVPLGVAAALLFDGALATGWLGAPVLPRANWMVYAGAVLVAAGLAFTVWARLVLAGNWSGTVTLKQSHELVRQGPYALARHPIYTGLLTSLLGTAVAIDAWRAVAAFAIVLLSFLRKMRTEEAFMRAAFGNAYDEYARATPALLPWLGRTR